MSLPKIDKNVLDARIQKGLERLSKWSDELDEEGEEIINFVPSDECWVKYFELVVDRDEGHIEQLIFDDFYEYYECGFLS